jgi:hypothetical protein
MFTLRNYLFHVNAPLDSRRFNPLTETAGIYSFQNTRSAVMEIRGTVKTLKKRPSRSTNSKLKIPATIAKQQHYMMLRYSSEIVGYRTINSIRTNYLLLQNLNPRWVCKLQFPKLPSYVTACNTICKSEISLLYMTHFPIPNIAKTTKEIISIPSFTVKI